MIFEFETFINPPTKNEERYKTIINRRTKRPMKIKNKDYYGNWNAITNEMYSKRFGMSKDNFDLLAPKDRAKLQTTLSKENVCITIFNGFHRIDLLNFANELLDRLEGIAYVNDRQVKKCIAFKDDTCEKEYFKIIVEVDE